MNENNNQDNVNNDDSQIVGTDLPTKEEHNSKAIDNFPAWLDEQLASIELMYEDFSTKSSRRGYFGRKK